MKKLFLLITAFTLTISVNAQELAYRNIFSGVTQNGIKQHNWQVQNMMSDNTNALGFYQSGRAFVIYGVTTSCLGAIGLGALAASGLFAYSPLMAVFSGTLLVGGVVMIIVGQNRIRQSVFIHNSGVQNRATSYQMDFGLTETGGLGLTLRF